MKSEELKKWFDEKNDNCPYCKKELDFQLKEGESKENSTAKYSAVCNCDSCEKTFIVEDDNNTGKIVFAEICYG